MKGKQTITEHNLDNIFGLIIVVFDRIYSESNRYKAKKQRKKYFLREFTLHFHNKVLQHLT